MGDIFDEISAAPRDIFDELDTTAAPVSKRKGIEYTKAPMKSAKRRGNDFGDTKRIAPPPTGKQYFQDQLLQAAHFGKGLVEPTVDLLADGEAIYKMIGGMPGAIAGHFSKVPETLHEAGQALKSRNLDDFTTHANQAVLGAVQTALPFGISVGNAGARLGTALGEQLSGEDRAEELGGAVNDVVQAYLGAKGLTEPIYRGAAKGARGVKSVVNAGRESLYRNAPDQLNSLTAPPGKSYNPDTAPYTGQGNPGEAQLQGLKGKFPMRAQKNYELSKSHLEKLDKQQMEHAAAAVETVPVATVRAQIGNIVRESIAKSSRSSKTGGALDTFGHQISETVLGPIENTLDDLTNGGRKQNLSGTDLVEVRRSINRAIDEFDPTADPKTIQGIRQKMMKSVNEHLDAVAPNASHISKQYADQINYTDGLREELQGAQGHVSGLDKLLKWTGDHTVNSTAGRVVAAKTMRALGKQPEGWVVGDDVVPPMRKPPPYRQWSDMKGGDWRPEEPLGIAGREQKLLSAGSDPRGLLETTAPDAFTRQTGGAYTAPMPGHENVAPMSGTAGTVTPNWPQGEEVPRPYGYLEAPPKAAGELGAGADPSGRLAPPSSGGVAGEDFQFGGETPQSSKIPQNEKTITPTGEGSIKRSADSQNMTPPPRTATEAAAEPTGTEPDISADLRHRQSDNYKIGSTVIHDSEGSGIGDIPQEIRNGPAAGIVKWLKENPVADSGIPGVHQGKGVPVADAPLGSTRKLPEPPPMRPSMTPEELAADAKAHPGVDVSTRPAVIETRRLRASGDSIAADIEGQLTKLKVAPKQAKAVGQSWKSVYEAWHDRTGMDQAAFREKFAPKFTRAATEADMPRGSLRQQEGTGAGGVEGKGGKTSDPGSFYDNTERAVEGWQGKGTPEQLIAHLKKTKGALDGAGDIGLTEWLQGKKSITKAEVLKFIDENRIEIEEVWKGTSNPMTRVEMKEHQALGSRDRLSPWEQERYDELDAKDNVRLATDPSEYAEYQVPGGENYRELLLTRGGQRAPPETYNSSHWPDHPVPDTLAHIRMNDRTLPDGRKVLFVEEIQSDWHQAGRKKGYKNPASEATIRDLKQKVEIARADLERATDEYYNRRKTAGEAKEEWDNRNTPARPDIDNAQVTLERAQDELHAATSDSGVPDAPFKGSGWQKLALKKIMHYASENGYDGVAWTPGEVQAKRYNLSQHVEDITYARESMIDSSYTKSQVAIKLKNGDHVTFLTDKDGVVTDNISGASQYVGKGLDDIIGKDLAKKILEKPDLSKHTATKGELSGLHIIRDGDGVSVGSSNKATPEAALAHYEKSLARQYQTISGDGLDIGGKGMKGFYDKILPDTANELAKRHGQRVGKVDIPTDATVKGWASSLEGLTADDVRTVIDTGNQPLQVTKRLEGVEQIMRHGIPIERVMKDFDVNSIEDRQLYQALGGNPEGPAQSAHYLPTPKEMRTTITNEKMPLFQKTQQGVIKGFNHIESRVIGLFEGKADISTILHESAHTWFETLDEKMRQPIEEWAGVKNGDWTVAAKEQFARATERYLREGVAPNAGLTAAFAQFKEWLTEIYKKVKGSDIDIKLTPEFRTVMDQMFGKDKPTTPITAAKPKTGLAAPPVAGLPAPPG